jgi:excisionase family DNA binding protein
LALPLRNSSVISPLLVMSVADDPSKRLVYTVPEAGRLLGLGRNAAYAAAQRGEIPTLRIGRLLLVPKIPLHRMLGIAGALTTTPVQKSDVGAKLPTAGERAEDA